MRAMFEEMRFRVSVIPNLIGNPSSTSRIPGQAGDDVPEIVHVLSTRRPRKGRMSSVCGNPIRPF